MIETATFVCSICAEGSSEICVFCTKDTCANHLCIRCHRCSDCCECDVPLTANIPEPEIRFAAEFTSDGMMASETAPAEMGATEVVSVETIRVVTFEPEAITPTQPEPLPPTQPEPLPQTQPDPVPQTDPEPLQPTVPEPVPGTDPQPETPGPSAAEPLHPVHQATTMEELAAALPELFAPEPAPPAALPDPDLNTPRDEVIEQISEAREEDEEDGERSEHNP